MPEDGKIHCWTLGEIAASAVGPSRMPPAISPIAGGCPNRANTLPMPCAAIKRIASATSNRARSMSAKLKVPPPCAVIVPEPATGGVLYTPNERCQLCASEIGTLALLSGIPEVLFVTRRQPGAGPGGGGIEHPGPGSA